MSQTHVAHTKPLSRMQSLSRGGSKVTKPSFSNSAKRYYSHLADSVLEPSLIKSALVYQYLYKKYFRSNTNIQESIYSHDNNACYVGPSLRSWPDSCVPGLSSWGKFFFWLLPHPTSPPHHFSNGPSLRHITCNIKHCEINNGQSVDMNIVFAS